LMAWRHVLPLGHLEGHTAQSNQLVGYQDP
jgi:hypothetical protein